MMPVVIAFIIRILITLTKVHCTTHKYAQCPEGFTRILLIGFLGVLFGDDIFASLPLANVRFRGAF